MSSASYGSRRDLLPKFMVAQSPAGHVGPSVLGLEESRAIEAVSLNRFPQASGGVIDWEGVPCLDRLAFSNEAEGERVIADVLRGKVGQNSDVVIFWGTLVMPTVVLSVESAVNHVSEILEVGPDFWVFSPNDKILIECLQDGQVTLASIPQE